MENAKIFKKIDDLVNVKGFDFISAFTISSGTSESPRSRYTLFRNSGSGNDVALEF